MRSHAKKVISLDAGPALRQELGRVVDVEDGLLLVSTAQGSARARRAASCLIEPEPGDEVIVALGANVAWVLAVLERARSAPARITADSDLMVVVRQGRFTVAASEGVDLVSTKDLSLTSAGLNVSANEGRVNVGKLSLLGDLVHAEVERIKVLAESVDSVLERLRQRVRRSYRQVEELDHLKAGQLDYSARDNLRLHGHNSLVTAEELVKLDGDQIHVG